MGITLRPPPRPLPHADHGVPIPPFSFPPAAIPVPSSHRQPATASPRTFRKYTKRENQHLQNKVRDLEIQLKKQQTQRPRPASPQRRKQSRSTSPKRDTRPRKTSQWRSLEVSNVLAIVIRTTLRATTSNPGGSPRSTPGHHARAGHPRHSAPWGVSGPHTPEA